MTGENEAEAPDLFFLLVSLCQPPPDDDRSPHRRSSPIPRVCETKSICLEVFFQLPLFFVGAYCLYYSMYK
jgi:hypothetical protein